MQTPTIFLKNSTLSWRTFKNQDIVKNSTPSRINKNIFNPDWFLQTAAQQPPRPDMHWKMILGKALKHENHQPDLIFELFYSKHMINVAILFQQVPSIARYNEAILSRGPPGPPPSLQQPPPSPEARLSLQRITAPSNFSFTTSSLSSSSTQLSVQSDTVTEEVIESETSTPPAFRDVIKCHKSDSHFHFKHKYRDDLLFVQLF